MNSLNFFNTFRGRLLVVFAALLITTLAVQYYLNVRAENENAARRERQEKSLVAGFTLGVVSIPSDDRLNVLKDKKPFANEYVDSIENILVINSRWQISDSLDSTLVPKINDKKVYEYKNLKDLTDLPPLLDADGLGADRYQFPNANVAPTSRDESEAHAVPVETDQGRWYVMVILRTDNRDAFLRAARPLIYTLGVLLTSMIVAGVLVWQFTRPIANLSDAARRIAKGDLAVRVPASSRDEMGRLTTRFNEMTARLAHARELETQLQQAEKSAVVGRLGSAIAHEIRNPLNYINLTLDHLRAKFAPVDDDKRETFERLTAQLKTEVARINRQISDFLDYSRPLQMDLQPTDVCQVVHDSMRIAAAEAHEKNIAVAINECGAIPPIIGDPEHLRSIFNNLFVNAVQATGANGQLNVIVEPAATTVKIIVHDTGSGIAPENLDKIFEPYFSTKETGTGLGLAIVKKIIDDHNGTITVGSKLNEGTTFTVELPRGK